jgi:hypothetical protein
MIKFISIFFIYCFLIYAVSAAESSKEPTFSDLAKLEEKQIGQYQGYKFDIIWIDHSPLIDITFIQVKDNKVVNLRDIAIIDPKKSKFDQIKTTMQLTGMESFKPANVTESGIIRDDRFEEGLIKFDFYDSKRNIRMTEWRTVTNGFALKKVLYDEDGKLLSATVYFQLKINRPFADVNHPINFFRLSLDDAGHKYGECNSENLDEIIDFCIKVVSQES